MKKFYVRIQLFALLFLVLGTAFSLQAQQSYTFTTAGATGVSGPSQTQINAAYLSTNLNGSVTVAGGIQSWTVPANGSYRIETYGAQGGGSTGGANTGSLGGFGAAMIGDFTLTAGQVLRILVGQQGGTDPYGGGGGGGSYVVNSLTVPLVVAGGGGGGNGYVGYSRGVFAGGCGVITTTAGNSNQTTGTYGAAAPGIGGGAIAMGGTQGYGGGGAVAAGGGGFYNNGGTSTNGGFPGLGFIQGGTGGAGNGSFNMGGFGGGGGGITSSGYGGGGGGYSGGGAGNWDGTTHGNGGGGGSLNSGSNQTNTACFNAGNGRVIIRELCNISLTSSGSSSLAPSICSGQSLTLSTNAISPYTWYNGNTTNNSIVVSPTVTTTYSIVGTSTAACVASAYITVTVSGGLPVLAIANPSNNICLGRTVSLTATGALTYTWTGGVVNGQTFTPVSTQNYTVSGQNGCGISTAVTGITISPLPVSVLASPSIVCQGFPSTLTAVAAVTGYTWQPVSLYGSSITVAPMANTIYTVTASDGTCSGTQTLTLNTKITPTITASAVNTVICQGASIVLTANGGSTYVWTPGNLSGSTITVSPLSSTLYSVAGTNSVNCTSSANQIILVNASPTLNIVANKTTVCAGDAVNLFASGATTYTWTNGPFTSSYTANPTSSTVYTVSGNQGTNICAGTNTIAITAIVSNVTVSSNTAVCPGGTATLTAGGATSYTWNGVPMGGNGSFQVSPSSTTIYTCVANTTSGSVSCPTTKTVQVAIFPNPTITVVATKSLICKAQSNTLTATGAVTYSWGAAGTGSVIVVKPNNTTIYSVNGIDINGCQGSQLISVIVNACLGVSELTSGNQSVLIYPNPSAGELTISSQSDISLKISNELGQEVKHIELSAQNGHVVSISDLASGIYMISGQNENGQVNQKVIVTK
ncbi:MAG: T9SS type A sorting domain-containing protein [bacterium]|nr:T9SS type A sorting domain-containing protein [bacterium]